MTEARFLYDQLAVVCPIVLALSGMNCDSWQAQR